MVHAFGAHGQHGARGIDESDAKPYACEGQPSLGVKARAGCIHIRMIFEKGFPGRINAANSWLLAGIGMAFESAQRDTSCMFARITCFLFGIVALLLLTGFQDSERSREAGPEYTSDGQLKVPEHYRD